MTLEHPQNSIVGTLRSELDEGDDVLHNNFNTLIRLIGEIRTAFVTYRINPEQAGNMCKDLKIVGSDGFEWTVGITSGGWFKRRSGDARWLQTAMPINVRVVGTEPDWVADGVNDWIAQAEAANKLLAETEPESMKPELDAGVVTNVPQNIQVVVDVSKIDSKKRPLQPNNLEDIDWLYSEWEQTDGIRQRQVKTLKQENLPPESNPDIALAEKIADVAAPTEREGSVQQGDSPEGRGGQKRPEDYFLRPE